MPKPTFSKNIDYQLLFDNSSDGILIHNLTTDLVIAVNQQCLELLDKTEEEILGKSPATLQLQTQLSQKDYEKRLNRIIEETKENKKTTNKRLHNKKDGSTIWFHIRTYLMPPPNDNLLVVFYQDITELENQQKMIAKQNKDLSAKNKELEAYIKSNTLLENFAFTAAHDLQSPINTMVSFSKFLTVSLQENNVEEAMEYADFINGAAQNLNALVKDLLAYSRAKSAQYNPETFDLNNLAQRLIKELNFPIQKSKATVNIADLPEDFVGDKIRIRQLLQNLLSNAIKFQNTDKKITPIVEINYENLADSWQFQVKDNGIGIEKKNYEEIFKLFRRLNHKKTYSGTGIGLALCHNIVEQHGGRIWLESEIGTGTTFYFTIPKPD